MLDTVYSQKDKLKPKNETIKTDSTKLFVKTVIMLEGYTKNARNDKRNSNMGHKEKIRVATKIVEEVRNLSI